MEFIRSLFSFPLFLSLFLRLFSSERQEKLSYVQLWQKGKERKKEDWKEGKGIFTATTSCRREGEKEREQERIF